MGADIGDEQPAVAVEGHAIRVAQGGLGRRPAVTGAPLGPGARDGGDGPVAEIDAANPGVALVGDVEEPAVAIEGQAVGEVDLGAIGRPAVAGEAGRAGADDRGDRPGAGIDAADLVVAGVVDVEVAGRVEHQVERHVQAGRRRRAAVAAVAGLAGADRAGDRRRLGADQ
jgi:hypothetical protein